MTDSLGQPRLPLFGGDGDTGKVSNANLQLSTIDKDASGTEVQTAMAEVLLSDSLTQVFANTDANKDGHLDPSEYSGFLVAIKSRTENVVESVVLPQRERTSSKRIRFKESHPDLEPPPDVKVEKMFPVFILTITFIEWIFYQYIKSDSVNVLLMFHPLKRYQIWRFVTPMLVHFYAWHFWWNVILQIILGSFLEIIHHWKRVAIIYFAGVIFGTLASSVIQPWTIGGGASGGVYALLFAHLSTIILNWNEMGFACCRCFFLLAYIAFEVWVAIYGHFTEGDEYNVSNATHVGGSLAGLVVGINVLKNLEVRGWEIKLQKMCRDIAIMLFLICFIANCGFQMAYSMSYWDQKGLAVQMFNTTYDNLNDLDREFIGRM